MMTEMMTLRHITAAQVRHQQGERERARDRVRQREKEREREINFYFCSLVSKIHIEKT